VAPEQQAQVPSTLPTTAPAASQHGSPASARTARDRRSVRRCRSSPARRSSSARRPAMRYADLIVPEGLVRHALGRVSYALEAGGKALEVMG